LCYRFGVSAFNTPQFNTAEYAAPQNTCQYCRQPISGAYYRIREVMSCPACADKLRATMAKSRASAYPLGLVCGMGAALLGMILYATFAILTGWMVSYVALSEFITRGSNNKLSGGLGRFNMFWPRESHSHPSSSKSRNSS
jgi:hypothetical protein